MKNLYLLFHTAYKSTAITANGFQGFYTKDVSSTAGCIDRLLPSTLRYPSILARVAGHPLER
jgi:hypothetical protein